MCILCTNYIAENSDCPYLCSVRSQKALIGPSDLQSAERVTPNLQGWLVREPLKMPHGNFSAHSCSRYPGYNRSNGGKQI